MADKEKKADTDLLEDITDEEITLSSNELDDILQNAEFAEEDGGDESVDLDLSADDDQLEKYGVWVKVKPEPLTRDQEEGASFELSDLDADEDLKLTDEEENLLSELEEELDREPGAPGSGGPELPPEDETAVLDADLVEGAAGPVDELADLDDLTFEAPEEESGLSAAEEELELEELSAGDLPEEDLRAEEPAEELLELGPEEEPGDGEIEVALSADEERPFDDLSAFDAPAAGAAAAGAAAAEEQPAIDSSRILQKIEQELESIRKEIMDLKRELTDIGRPAEGPLGMDVEPAPAVSPGFFTEEEDETIALTGDELDNILNNADVTEETQEPAAGLEGEEELDLAAESAPAQDAAPDESLIDREDLIDLGSLDEEEEPVAEAAQPVAGAAQPVAGAAQPGLAPEDELVLDLDESGVEEEGETSGEADLPEIELEELAMELSEEDLPLEELSAEGLQVEAEEEPADLEDLLDEVAPPEEQKVHAEPVEDVLEELEAETPEAALQAVGEPIAEPLDLAGEEPLPGEEPLVDDLEIEGLEPEEPSDQSIQIGGEEELVLEEDNDSAPQATAPAALGQAAAPALDEEELEDLPLETEALEQVEPAAAQPADEDLSYLKSDLRSVLKYLDTLLEELPEEKIEEFAHSEYFSTYRKLLEDLGLAD